MSDSSLNAPAEWNPASEPNGGAAISDSSGQLRAIPAGEPAPAAEPLRAVRADEPRVAGHCLWPAVEVSGPETARLRFRQRSKPKAPISKVVPVVPAPPTAPKARNAAESASSSTGIFDRAPSGVHPAAESGVRVSTPPSRISSRVLQAPNPKRIDPRAVTPATLPLVKPAAKTNDFLYTLTKRLLYAVILVSILTGIALIVTRLVEDARIEQSAAVRPFEKNVDMSLVRDRMKRLESECAANQALLKQQESELKGMKCDMSEFERSRTDLTDKMASTPTPQNQ